MSVYIRRWGDVMSTLLLRLAGPMQSWGVESKFEVRRSGTEPSKSAVIGLIAAAMGRRRDSSLDDLNQLMFGVRVDQPGFIQRDFQMVKNEKTSYLTYRYYLADAVFLVGVESEDNAFLEQIEHALRNPVFHLYLGRKSYPLDLPLIIGIRQCPLEKALTSEPWLVSDWRQIKEKSLLRIVMDSKDQYSAISTDLPVSFNPENRLYGKRFTKEFVVNIDNRSNTTHDVFAELE